MRRQYTGHQRAGVLALVRSGVATVAEAAARLGVTPSTAYYWVRGAARGGRGPARRAPASIAASARPPTFVRVVPSSAVDTGISLRVGTAEIQVRRGFDPEILRAVVEALGGGA